MRRRSKPILFSGIAALCAAAAACAPPQSGAPAGAAGARSNEGPATVPVSVPGVSRPIPLPAGSAVSSGIGIRSNHRPIEEAPPEVRALGQAVAKVYLGGSAGTGFFISPTGLFLTNEHVVPRRACVRERCPGLKIALNFARDGQPRVFMRARPLLTNRGQPLDFTLLQVDVGGEPVPFIPLETRSYAVLAAGAAGNRIFAIGHPVGAPLKYAPARPLRVEAGSLIFQGLVHPGNSGSPLVNATTGRAIGLVFGVEDRYVRSDDPSTVVPRRINYAAPAWALASIFKASLDARDVESIPNLASAERLPEAGPRGLEPNVLAPPSPETFRGALWLADDDPRLKGALEDLRLYIGTENETRALGWLIEMPTGLRNGRLNMGAARALGELQLAMGRRLRFSRAAFDLLQNSLDLADENALLRARISLLAFGRDGDELRALCAQRAAAGSADSVGMASLVICGALRMSSGASALIAALNQAKAQDYSNFSNFNLVALILESAGPAGARISAEEAAALDDIVTFVRSKTDSTQVDLAIEGSAADVAKGMRARGSFGPSFEGPGARANF